MGAIRHQGGIVQGHNIFEVCHRGDSHGAVAKDHGGGGSNVASPATQAYEVASQTPTRKLTEAAAAPTAGPAPVEPATRSADDQARDTHALWESHCLANSNAHRGPFCVFLQDIHVTMGLLHVKGLFVLHVCVLTLVGRLFNSERASVKEELKTFF